MEVRNDGAGEGRREAAVFRIRPLKLAAKSAPATLQHCTDLTVSDFRDLAIMGQRDARNLGPPCRQQPVYERDKVGGEDESANSNGKFEQRRRRRGWRYTLPPSSSHTPSERSTTVHNLVSPSLPPFLLSAILSSALVSEHVAPT